MNARSIALAALATLTLAGCEDERGPTCEWNKDGVCLVDLNDCDNPTGEEGCELAPYVDIESIEYACTPDALLLTVHYAETMTGSVSPEANFSVTVYDYGRPGAVTGYSTESVRYAGSEVSFAGDSLSFAIPTADLVRPLELDFHTHEPMLGSSVRDFTFADYPCK